MIRRHALPIDHALVTLHTSYSHGASARWFASDSLFLLALCLHCFLFFPASSSCGWRCLLWCYPLCPWQRQVDHCCHQSQHASHSWTNTYSCVSIDSDCSFWHAFGWRHHRVLRGKEQEKELHAITAEIGTYISICDPWSCMFCHILSFCGFSLCQWLVSDPFVFVVFLFAVCDVDRETFLMLSCRSSWIIGILESTRKSLRMVFLPLLEHGVGISSSLLSYLFPLSHSFVPLLFCFVPCFCSFSFLCLSALFLPTKGW